MMTGTGRMGARASWMFRVAVAFSQLANAALLSGNPNESISGRAWRQGVLHGRPGWARARRWINGLFFLQEDHCFRAYLSDVTYAQHVMAEEEKRQAGDLYT